MKTTMEGWSIRERLYIFHSLSYLNFNQMEKKMPNRSRKEIKEGVINMINIIAEATPAELNAVTDFQDSMREESKNLNLHPPSLEVVTPFLKEMFPHIYGAQHIGRMGEEQIQELYHEMISEEKPTVSDAVVLQIQDEECIEVNTTATPMPPPSASKHCSALGSMYYNKPIYTSAGSAFLPANKNLNTVNASASYALQTANRNVNTMNASVKINMPANYSSANSNVMLYIPMQCQYGPVTADAQKYNSEIASVKPSFVPACEPVYIKTQWNIDSSYVSAGSVYPKHPSPNAKSGGQSAGPNRQYSLASKKSGIEPGNNTAKGNYNYFGPSNMAVGPAHQQQTSPHPNSGIVQSAGPNAQYSPANNKNGYAGIYNYAKGNYPPVAAGPAHFQHPSSLANKGVQSAGPNGQYSPANKKFEYVRVHSAKYNPDFIHSQRSFEHVAAGPGHWQPPSSQAISAVHHAEPNAQHVHASSGMYYPGPNEQYNHGSNAVHHAAANGQNDHAMNRLYYPGPNGQYNHASSGMYYPETNEQYGHASSGMYYSGANGQYGHAMNRKEY